MANLHLPPSPFLHVIFEEHHLENWFERLLTYRVQVEVNAQVQPSNDAAYAQLYSVSSSRGPWETKVAVDKSAWRTDEEFGRERLRSVNVHVMSVNKWLILANTTNLTLDKVFSIKTQDQSTSASAYPTTTGASSSTAATIPESVKDQEQLQKEKEETRSEQEARVPLGLLAICRIVLTYESTSEPKQRRKNHVIHHHHRYSLIKKSSVTSIYETQVKHDFKTSGNSWSSTRSPSYVASRETSPSPYITSIGDVSYGQRNDRSISYETGSFDMFVCIVNTAVTCPDGNTISVGLMGIVDTRGSYSIDGERGNLIGVPSSMSKRQRVGDTSSFCASVPGVMVDFDDRILSYRPRKHKLSSRFKENGVDASPGVSSKRQNICDHCRYENASTLNSRPAYIVDSSTPSVSGSGSCAHHTCLPSGYIYVGTCEHCCEHCGAQFWYEERIKDSPKRARTKYYRCCMAGRVVIRTYQIYPEYIKLLLKDRHLLENIKAYNQMFSLTSLGSLCPREGDPPRFLQLYVYDTENEVDNRMRHFRADNSGLRRDIVEGAIVYEFGPDTEMDYDIVRY
ncbi:hypothetical protein Tco_0663534 [Tanacetum coccineum]